MLNLKNIVKNYYVGDDVVKALRGVTLNFRKSEFVAVLGQSGCGKTTLLNIVGGLDKYTDGDLIINGVSTKKYTDRDWDSYRNNTIGFVFQSYNLIPHQTVFENVELALTLSGVSQEERKRRVIEALNKVGLGDQIKKRPNQLSGGQMQRVAIARAIVNNPDIILADEPTGALDSDTSIQIMDILKDISKEKLVIMVTHNPELAKEYSTRIINLKDGEVLNDSSPYEEVIEKPVKVAKSKKSKHSMGFFTALKLSLKNLFTKKARTILTSFAGSIGIVGIALILSLSSGFTTYIDKVQVDALSNYPITIEKSSVDATNMMGSLMGNKGNGEAYPDGNKVNTSDSLSEIFSVIYSNAYENDLKSLKNYLDLELQKEENKDKVSAVQYIYDLDVSWYTNEGLEVNDFSMANLIPSASMADKFMGGAFQEMIDNEELIKSQYDILYGRLPGGELKANEAVLVLDNYNGINDLNLYNMGFKTDKLEYNILKTYLTMSMLPAEMIESLLNSAGYSKDSVNQTYTFDDFKDLTFKVLTKADYYVKSGSYYEDLASRKFKVMNGTTSAVDRFMRKMQLMLNPVDADGNPNTLDSFRDARLLALEQELMPTATEVKIVGIVRKKEGVTSGALKGTVCYTKELTELLIDKTKQTKVYKAQENSNKNVVSGEVFKNDEAKELFLESIGVVNKDSPVEISIYPTTFENKDFVVGLIDEYNKGMPAGQEIKYTDYLGTMMSSITIIINAISYVLIAFVSISLIVSSIMIGIITYISVLERTKEIGVLRSLGASKKDISRVFNAETLIVGFVAGVLGLLITVILNIPITIIVQNLAEITAVAALPFWGGVLLVIISTLLTLVAGIIPARMAAKKDPVIALRTE